MEEMIAKIVEIDKKAREMNEKAQKTKLNYENEVLLTKEKIKTDYLERANKRILINQQTAQKRADEKLAGITEKNQAVIQKLEKSYAENGDIVVAFVDGEDATVKRFYKEKGYYRLQPENDTMDPIILDECEILGKVIGLKRYY